MTDDEELETIRRIIEQELHQIRTPADMESFITQISSKNLMDLVKVGLTDESNSCIDGSSSLLQKSAELLNLVNKVDKYQTTIAVPL